MYPPIIGEFRELGEKDKAVSEQIVNAEAYSASIKELKVNSSTLDAVYDSAGRALPVSAESELLLLDLEGLVNSIGLKGLTISVPFQGTAASATASSQSATSGATDEVKRGNTATTKPVVKDGATADALTVTLSGSIDYSKANELLSKLKTFSRWNKVKSIDITKSGDTYATTISLEVFTKPAPSTSFTDTSAEFLKGAQALFSPMQTYTSKPNASSEGQFGKANPFD